METPEHDAQIEDPSEDIEELEETDDDDDMGDESAGTAEAPTGP